MSRKFARSFYRSKEWLSVREYVLRRDGGMCQFEGCNKPAEEVHHRTHLTPENILDPDVTLDPDNLVSLCREHHFAVHKQDRDRGRKAYNTRADRSGKKEILQRVTFVDGVPVPVKNNKFCGDQTKSGG